MSVNSLTPLKSLDDIIYSTVAEIGSEAGAYSLIKDQNLPDYVKYPTVMLSGIVGGADGHVLNKYGHALSK